MVSNTDTGPDSAPERNSSYFRREEERKEKEEKDKEKRKKKKRVISEWKTFLSF